MSYFEELSIQDIIRSLSNNFGIHNFWDLGGVMVDVGLVSVIIYRLVLLLRETRAWQLLKGILTLLIAAKLSGVLGLKTIAYILDHAVSYIAIALVVIFQPELRSTLEKIGRTRLRFLFDFTPHPTVEQGAVIIEEVVDATTSMAKANIGALIVIERQTKMGEIIHSGVELEARITSELLQNIFTPNTPLHDGAVIIRNETLKAAGCFLPLSNQADLNKGLGTRHRAAVGITEVSDALCIVISEETGQISVAKEGILSRSFDKNSLRELLLENLMNENDEAKRRHLWKVKKK